MKPLLTIIVPAYNVEKYIEDCLRSLVNQSVINHKVVIVNDGSTDNTEKICLRFKEKYSDFITYVYQENKGLGEARNVGMGYVDTPYVAFLDSDDWLNIKYVEQFSKLVEDTDELPDIVFTLPWIYNSVTRCVEPWMDKNLLDRLFRVKDGVSRVQINSQTTPELYALEVNACRKIYKMSFLKEKQFTFPKGLKWEDVPGHFYLLHEANTCMALPEVGFFYRINQGGQITAGGGASRLDMIPIFKELLNVQKKMDFNCLERAYVIRLIVNFSLWSVDVTNQQYIDELLKGLHEIYQNFDSKDIDSYLDSVSLNRIYESGFINCIRSNEYKKLNDYETRNEIMAPFSQREKHNILLGGIRCVYDHGVGYTIVLALKKVKRRILQ